MGKCPYCGAEVELKSAYEVYHTANSKDWGNLWVCSNYPRCDAYVGCHKNTDIPLGRLANSRLRELKKEAHRQFDPIWKSGLMSRKEAYRWLADMLHISCEECHIGMFDVKQCQKVIHLCRKQTNDVIVEYRNRVYGDRKFTRGYKRQLNKH